MGEISHMKVGGARPRPLGLVKSESIHFEDVHSVPSAHHDSGRAQDTLYFYGRSRTEGDFRHELKSMRDLQETLRQAALLNIVAAVNHENKTADSNFDGRAEGTQSVGIKGASLLGHTVATGGHKLVLVNKSSDLAASGTFSRHLQAGVTNGHTMPPALPSTAAAPTTALGHLLNQRSRTISIPRPRTNGEQNSFMHKSLSDAKEQLANMTNFRARPKQETDVPPSTAHHNSEATSAEEKAHKSVAEKNPVNTSNHNEMCQKSKILAETPYALHGTSLDSLKKASPLENHRSSTNQFHTPYNQANDGHTSRLSKEDQRAHNVHQMQSLKRHITTSKKKELVKRLTEIAKCEAVDISEPVKSDNQQGAPPMIIVASKRDYPRYEDSLDGTRSSSTGQRTKSMTSLQGRDEAAKVPSNSRVHSETLDAMATYREAKRLSTLNVTEDLRIESIGSVDANGTDIHRRSRHEYRPHVFEEYQNDTPDLNFLAREHLFSDSIVGKHMQLPASPDVLELRPMASSPVNTRNHAADRKKITYRRIMNPIVRDRLVSPSPVVYEASYHKPKASAGKITLIGQSLPSVSVSRPATQNFKPASRKFFSETKTSDTGNDKEENISNPWEDITERGQSLSLTKPWGSTAKQTSISLPILKTQIIDHLQCVGIVDKRPPVLTTRKSISKISGANVDFSDRATDVDEFQYEEIDKCSDTSITGKADYKKSKLYNAFRASEENLANLAEVSSLVSEALTTRSLLNQPAAQLPETITTIPESQRDPVQSASKEPLYMGCSSRVSENEIRSQFHYINSNTDGETPKPGANFKVFKALDQDVYFDFQHRKYRNNNNGNTLNTAANKPRMHFIKIEYSGISKS